MTAAAAATFAAAGISPALAAVASPNNVYGSATPTKPIYQFITTNYTDVTPTYGIAPYSYSWARVSGSPAISASSPTSANTAFSGTVPGNTLLTASFRCVVTDNVGATTTSNDVEVNLENSS